MGQMLDEPIVTKDTHVGDNDYLQWGCSSMQGFRVSMEDRHTCLTDQLISEKKFDLKFLLNGSGVFDGHSGQTAADFSSKELFKQIKKVEEKNLEGGAKGLFLDDEKIILSYLAVDEAFEKKFERNPDSSGTTCISTILYKEDSGDIKIICNNVGDSRCVVSDFGKVSPLSFDHKPTNKEEMERIQKAGGYVEFGRVNGTLALSRAFGDMAYKRNQNVGPRDQCVIAVPGITRYTVQMKEEKKGRAFVVLACDGIWDVMNNKTVCDFVEKRLDEMEEGTYDELRKTRYEGLYKKKELHPDIRDKNQLTTKWTKGKYDLGRICEDLIDECVIELDSKDNVSAIIVLFK